MGGCGQVYVWVGVDRCMCEGATELPHNREMLTKEQKGYSW